MDFENYKALIRIGQYRIRILKRYLKSTMQYSFQKIALQEADDTFQVGLAADLRQATMAGRLQDVEFLGLAGGAVEKVGVLQWRGSWGGFVVDP